MPPKDADRLANRVDPDQTAPCKEQSGLDLHCLLKPICPYTLYYYGTSFSQLIFFLIVPW